MLDYPPGSTCQAGCIHITLHQRSQLLGAGIEAPECEHGLYVTDLEGAQTLLSPAHEAPLNGDHPHPEPTVERLAMGGYKANTHVETTVINESGGLFGAGLDPSIRRAVTRARLALEPPEQPVERIRVADPIPPVTSSLLMADQGPLVFHDPLAPTLVAGPAKAGKTAVAAAMLGELRKVPAVWLYGEGLRRAWTLLQQVGANRVTLYRIPVGKAVDKTAQLVAEDQPQLAVVDPYGIAASLWGIDVNHETAPSAILRRVHDIVGEIPVILVAHDRKSSDQDRSGPPLDRIRGSSALPGLAGIVHQIRTRGDGRSHIRTIAYRDGPLPDPWTLDLATMTWMSASPADARKVKIIQVLEAATKPLSKRGIDNEGGGGRALRVQDSDLDELEAEGRIHRAGKYHSHQLWAIGPPPPPTLL